MKKSNNLSNIYEKPRIGRLRLSIFGLRGLLPDEHDDRTERYFAFWRGLARSACAVNPRGS